MATFFDNLLNAFGRKNNNNGGNRDTTGTTVQAQAKKQAEPTERKKIAKNQYQQILDSYKDSRGIDRNESLANNIGRGQFGQIADNRLKDYTSEQLAQAKQLDAMRRSRLENDIKTSPNGKRGIEAEKILRNLKDNSYEDYLAKRSDDTLLGRTSNSAKAGLTSWTKGVGGDIMSAKEHLGLDADDERETVKYLDAQTANNMGRTPNQMYDEIVMNAVNNGINGLMTSGEIALGGLTVGSKAAKALGLLNMAGSSYGNAYSDVRLGNMGEQYMNDMGAADRYALANAGNELLQESIPGGYIAGAEIPGLSDFAGEFAQEGVGALLDPYMNAFLDYDPIKNPEQFSIFNPDSAVSQIANAPYTDENGDMTLQTLGQGIAQRGKEIGRAALAGGLGGALGGAASYVPQVARQVGTDVNTLGSAQGVAEALEQFERDFNEAEVAMADFDTASRLQPAMAKTLSGNDSLRQESTDVDAETGFENTVKSQAAATLRKYVRGGALRSSIGKYRTQAQQANEKLIRDSAKRTHAKVREEQLGKMIEISNALGIPFEFKDNGYFIKGGFGGQYRILSKKGDMALIRGEIEIPADPTKIPGLNDRNVAETFMHEVNHVLEGTPEYKKWADRLRKLEAQGRAKDRDHMFGSEHLANLGGDYGGNTLDMDPNEVVRGYTEDELSNAVLAAKYIAQDDLLLYDPEGREQYDHRETTKRLYGDDYSDVKDGEVIPYNGEREYRTPNQAQWEREINNQKDTDARARRVSTELLQKLGIPVFKKKTNSSAKTEMTEEEKKKAAKKAFKTKDDFIIASLARSMGEGQQHAAEFLSYLKEHGGFSKENVKAWSDIQKEKDPGYRGILVDQEHKMAEIEKIFPVADSYYDETTTKETEEKPKEIDIPEATEKEQREILGFDVDELMGEGQYVSASEYKTQSRGRDEFKNALQKQYGLSEEQLEKATDIIIKNGGYNEATIAELKENGINDLLFRKEGGTQQFNPKDRINALYENYAPARSIQSIIGEEQEDTEVREEFEKSLSDDDKEFLKYLKANAQKIGVKQQTLLDENGEPVRDKKGKKVIEYTDAILSSKLLESKTKRGGDKYVIDKDGAFLGTTVNDVYRGLTQDLRQLYLGDVAIGFSRSYATAQTKEELQTILDEMKALKKDIDDVKANGIKAEYFERNGIKELSKADAKAIKDKELKRKDFVRILNLPADMSYEDKLKASLGMWKGENVTKAKPKKASTKQTVAEAPVETVAENPAETPVEAPVETPVEITNENMTQSLIDAGIPEHMAKNYGERFEDRDIVERLMEKYKVDEDEAETMLNQIKTGEFVAPKPMEAKKATPQETPQEETAEAPQETTQETEEVKPDNWLAEEYTKLGASPKMANTVSKSMLSGEKYGKLFSKIQGEIAKAQGISMEEAAQKLYDLSAQVSKNGKKKTSKKVTKDSKPSDIAKKAKKEGVKKTAEEVSEVVKEEVKKKTGKKKLNKAEEKVIEKVAEESTREALEDQDKADAYMNQINEGIFSTLGSKDVSNNRTMKRIKANKYFTETSKAMKQIADKIKKKPVIHDSDVRADSATWFNNLGINGASEWATTVLNRKISLPYIEVSHAQYALDEINSMMRDAEMERRKAKGKDEELYKATTEAVEDLSKLAEPIAQVVKYQGSNAGRVLRSYARTNRNKSNSELLTDIDVQIDKINNDAAIKKRLKSKITLSEELRSEFIHAVTDEERSAVMEKIKEHVANQIPSTFRDKLHQWRMLMMLGNPRTMIRNEIGNTMTAGMFRLSDYTKAALELVLKEENRTAALSVPQEYKDFAQYVRETTGYTDEAYTDKLDAKSVLRYKKGNFSNDWIVGKGVNYLSNKVSENLEASDIKWITRRADSFLSQALVAKGYTVTKNNDGTFTVKDKQNKQIKEGVLNEMMDRALQDAQEATFHDASAVADTLNRFKNVPFFGDLLEVVMPYVKTPVNIGKRAIEFTPAGILKTTYHALDMARGGKSDANTVINNLSRNMTGTGVMMLGMMLAKMGVLAFDSPDEDDDYKTKYYKQNIFGKQDYALVIGKHHYSLDWALPSAAPLIVGAELANAGFTAESFAKANFNAVMSMVNASYLQSIKDLLDDFNRGYNVEPEDDEEEISDAKRAGLGLIEVGKGLGENLAGQIAPTAGGALNRTLYSTKKTTQSTNYIKGVVNRALMNVPVLGPLALENAVDQKGQEIKNVGVNPIQRAVINFILPPTITVDRHDEIDEKLLEAGAVPMSQAGLRYRVDYDSLTDKQYKQVKKEYYGDYNKYAKQFVGEPNSKQRAAYLNLGNYSKGRIFNNLSNYALAKAKGTYFKGVGDTSKLYTEEQAVANYLEGKNIDPSAFFEMKQNGLSQKQQALYLSDEYDNAGVLEDIKNQISQGKLTYKGAGLTEKVADMSFDDRLDESQKYIDTYGESLASSAERYRKANSYAEAEEVYQSRQDAKEATSAERQYNKNEIDKLLESRAVNTGMTKNQYRSYQDIEGIKRETGGTVSYTQQLKVAEAMMKDGTWANYRSAYEAGDLNQDDLSKIHLNSTFLGWTDDAIEKAIDKMNSGEWVDVSEFKKSYKESTGKAVTGTSSKSTKSSTTKTQAEKDAESARKAMLSAFTKAMSNGSSTSSKISASVSTKSTDLWDSIVNGNKRDVEALRKELKL